MADTPESLRWMAFASCRDTHPEVFFPVTEEATRPARAVCAGCPVREDCLAYALANRIHDGVWGGTSERERRALRLGAALGR